MHNATLFTPAAAAGAPSSELTLNPNLNPNPNPNPDPNPIPNQGAPSSEKLYLTFYTNSGREYEGTSGALLAFGYIGNPKNP